MKMRKKMLFVILIVFCLLILSAFVKADTEESWKFFYGTKTKTELTKKKYIKWVEFGLTLNVLNKASKLDIDSHVNNVRVKYNWIELISYLACRYGNDFRKFKQSDLDRLTQRLRNGETMETLTKDLEYYSYYFESYNAILGEFIGEYEVQVASDNNQKIFEKKYGIKAFLPIAKNYSFDHYKDFGASRSYGYKREHLGNDLMGRIGTPIIAIESGIVEAARVESVWWLENRN